MEQLVEQIKPIKDFEGLYSISNYGYIISETKEWIIGNGGIRTKQETVLKITINSNGYPCLALCKNGIYKHYSLHFLVWDSFGYRPRLKGEHIDHIDEDKLNPRIDNLQPLTQRENSTKYHKTQNHTSKYVGVNWSKVCKKWHSVISVNGKQKHLGYFTDEYEAHLAYQDELRRIE